MRILVSMTRIIDFTVSTVVVQSAEMFMDFPIRQWAVGLTPLDKLMNHIVIVYVVVFMFYPPTQTKQVDKQILYP